MCKTDNNLLIEDMAYQSVLPQKLHPLSNPCDVFCVNRVRVNL